MCLASRTDAILINKVGFFFLHFTLLLNVSVLVAFGLITSKTGCVPEEEGGFSHPHSCFVSIEGQD